MTELLCKDSLPKPLKDPPMQKFLKDHVTFVSSPEEYIYPHVLATPLLECLSISIYSNDGKPCQVYGTIQVIDGEGATFDLYNREKNDEEMISSSGSLTLTFSEGRVISPSDQVEVVIDIKDKTRKAAIAKGVLCWDYRVKDDYDKVQTEYIYGKCGYATVRYITCRYAVIATVEVLLVRGSDDASCVDADVYGNIVAHCGNTFSSTLFDKTRNQSVRMKFGSSINLSRRVVIVPAYSSLVITADLWNRDTQQQICCKDLEFEAQHRTCILTERVEGQDGTIKVAVQWSHLYMQPPPERKLKYGIEEASNKNLDGKKPRVLSDETSRSSQTKPKDTIPLLEVFSVVIGRSNNDEAFDLWGSIKVFHWSGETLIFSKDKQSAERLLPNQTAPIIAPTKSFRGYEFEIKVDLRDAKDSIISSGYLGWIERNLDTPISWYDRQLCSVFRGDTGYAAVHYTVFSAGVQATIKVCLVGENCSGTNCLQVHGSVFTEYSNFKYVTCYDKEHYRNKLFQKHLENPELLQSSPEDFEFVVPLLKSVVVVPHNYSLIVDLDLTVTHPQQTQSPSSNGKTTIDDMLQAVETLQGRLEFNTHDDCDMGGCNIIDKKNIQGLSHNVFVYVEWNKVSVSVKDMWQPDLPNWDDHLPISLLRVA